MFKIRCTVFLALVALVLMALPLAAQGGQYVILSAQYGHERRHVDVTDRIKQLARAGRPFKVSPRDFGVDPAPQETKSLRIYALGPDGKERMFEYLGGTFVDGEQFRGWHGGEWGRGEWSGRW